MYLCIDIGGSSIKLAVMDQNSNIIDWTSITSPKTNIDDFFTQISPYILLQKASYSIKGIAVSSCGAVDCDSGIIYGSSALPYIHGPNIKQLFNEHFSLPCEIENDANCAALGELWKGEATQVQDFCLAVIGSGIGGSVIINRNVTHGKQLHRGEFGYMIACYDEDFPLTFSDVASTRGLVESAAKALDIAPEELDGIKVFQLAEQEKCEQNSGKLTDVIDKWYQNLATGLFNIQYCLDPEIILLGGAISSRTDLITHLDRHINFIMQKQPVCRVKPKLKLCSASNNSNLIGALYHFLSRRSETVI